MLHDAITLRIKACKNELFCLLFAAQKKDAPFHLVIEVIQGGSRVGWNRGWRIRGCRWRDWYPKQLEQAIRILLEQ